MYLEFEESNALPLMSWCASVGRDGVVRVWHGQGVETRSDRFLEGAWDGDFEAFDFDGAMSVAGSGAVLRDGVCVFAAPFHPLEKIFVLQGERETLLSNSLVFLLEQADDGLDSAHPTYFFDLVRMVRRGITRQPTATLPTARGRRVEIYVACRLWIDADLRLQCRPMPLGHPPTNYAEYFELLRGTAERIVRNAADPARKRTYQSVAACSRGYDSTACAAIASQVGCTRGYSFARSGSPNRHPLLGMTKPFEDDSGEESLRALGIEATVRDRLEVLKIPGHPKAEFFMRPAASTDASERIMEDLLQGSVFFSGRHGERFWGPTSRCARRHLREMDDVNLSGHAYGEFRMRAGFVHLPLPYVGALHGPAIYRITHSEEMLPWKLGTGYYDRPIARRIAEEAGVPRECFGHAKRGSGESASSLGEESERDFQEFLRNEVPEDVRRRLDPRRAAERNKMHYRVAYVRTQYSHYRPVEWALDVFQTDRMHRLWGSQYQYVFHWGFEKMRVRYAARR